MGRRSVFKIILHSFCMLALLMLAGCSSRSSGGRISLAPGAQQAGDVEGASNTILAGSQVNGGEGPPGGDEGATLDDPITSYDEQDVWSIVPFTDPRTQETYDIIDGRVLVSFKNPPPVPQVDPNYFDAERLPTDQAYSIPYPPIITDPDIAAFIAAEGLEVISDWKCIKSIGASLPEGQTVEDAVANWPQEYSEIIDTVDPDAVDYNDSTPPETPNDDRFINPPPLFSYPTESQWAINGTNSKGDIHIRQVWAQDEQNGAAYTNPTIAIIDSGVDFDNVIGGINTYNLDLTPNSTLYGCNVGDSKASTTFLTRESEGGEPWQWLKDLSADNAINIGHGTGVAGVCSAATNNDGNDLEDSRDISGIAYKPKYFPIAVKYKGGYSKLAKINAYIAVGCVQGCIDKTKEYGAGFFVPHYQVEVANCSTGGPAFPCAEQRTLDRVTPFILFVCAAGNTAGTQSQYPAHYAPCLSVGAYNQQGNWICRNCSDIKISAPGSDIWTTDMIGTNSNGDDLGFGHGSTYTMSGTSISTPHVSAVALLISCKMYWLTPAQVKDRVISKAVYSISVGPPGVGRVDAWMCLYELP